MSDLRENELEALRVLWEEGKPLKPSEIQDGFSFDIDNGTLRSTLKVLMDKGHVTRTKKGKAFIYRPATTRERLLSKMVERLSRIFSGGSSADLITQLIKTENLSPEEIEELRRIAHEKAEVGPLNPKRGRRS